MIQLKINEENSMTLAMLEGESTDSLKDEFTLAEGLACIVEELGFKYDLDCGVNIIIDYDKWEIEIVIGFKVFKYNMEKFFPKKEFNDDKVFLYVFASMDALELQNCFKVFINEMESVLKKIKTNEKYLILNIGK